MASRSDSKPSHRSLAADPDGIVRTRVRPDRGARFPFFFLLMVALAGLMAAPLWLLLRGARGTSARPHAPSPPSATARPPRATPNAHTPHPASTGGGTTTDGDEDAAPETASSAGDVGQSSTREGIYAFPAPGTKRIKVGIVVPDDFELPPGYVRHYQATDKGEMLPAILMFHPLTPPLDARGNPVEVPADRIVPADMAPPGLPIEMLHVPENAYADPNDPGPIPADVNHQGAGDSDP